MQYLIWTKKILFTPVTRLRICLRKIRMRHLKIAIGTLTALSCFLTLILYYGRRSPPRSLKIPKIIQQPMINIPLDVIYKDLHIDIDKFEYIDNELPNILHTRGCKIPLIGLNFENVTKTKHACHRRAIILTKIKEENKVKVYIDNKILQTYLKGLKFSNCSYSFFEKSEQVGLTETKLIYTPWKLFHQSDVISLKTDFIKIICYGNITSNRSIEFYEDVYGFIKKKQVESKKDKKFNVLFIGMDSMSFFRVISTMPRIKKFFYDNSWLTYRGYHKIGENTFPNLMAALTGKDISSILDLCSGKMDKCNEYMIWSKFKSNGYVTAYGEDYLRLPDTFSGNNAFHTAPTDHFLKPLYMSGEMEIANGSLVCAGKVTSAQLMLDYALDFAVTYRNHSFFGVFWINSHSHNVHSSPRDMDKPLEEFLYRLSYSHVTDNTFVFFLSDHGIRFGPQRMKIESYYDERLPALFIWVPPIHRALYPQQYNNAIINQFRLTTPYDVYSTLSDINDLSIKSFSSSKYFRECPKCVSLFTRISPDRTCEDANIHTKWCSCHRMYELVRVDTEGYKSVIFVMNEIRSKSQMVKTDTCWGCSMFSLKNVIRIYYYYDASKSNLYHVVAFTLMPGNVSYEAIILRKNEPELVGPISLISAYRGLGKCVLEHKERLYCACQRIEKCQGL